jgi:hypothetical protein
LERVCWRSRAEFDVGDYLQSAGLSAFLRIAVGQTLADVELAIVAALDIDKETAKKVKFFAGTT